MKTFKPIRTVTCKCDSCGALLRYDHEKEITAMFDTVSQMVVCDCCQDDFEKSAKVYGSSVNWHGVPTEKIDFEEREYEPDYDND